MKAVEKQFLVINKFVVRPVEMKKVKIELG